MYSIYSRCRNRSRLNVGLSVGIGVTVSVLSDKVRVVVNNIIIELSHTPVRWKKKMRFSGNMGF